MLMAPWLSIFCMLQVTAVLIGHAGVCFPPTPTFSDFQMSLRNVLEKYRDGVLVTELENIYQARNLIS